MTKPKKSVPPISEQDWASEYAAMLAEEPAPQSYVQCYTENHRKQRVRKKPLDSSISVSFMEAEPLSPSKEHPEQRAIRAFTGETTDKCVIYLTATGLLEKYRPKGIEHTSFQDKFRRKIVTPAVERHIFREPLELLDFRPLLSPFVPSILQILVNSIETYCRAHSWKVMFENLEAYNESAKEALIQLVGVHTDNDVMKDICGKLSHYVKVETVRLFLNELRVKPLYLSKAHTVRLSEIPLLDFFLRPHRGVRKIVQSAMMSASCVGAHTMAFLMIHLMHAWTSTDCPPNGRLILSSIYGRLLITFNERPEFSNEDYGEGKTIESALLEVILDTCDHHFWNYLSGLKIRAAFKHALKIKPKQTCKQKMQINDKSAVVEDGSQLTSSLTDTVPNESDNEIQEIIYQPVTDVFTEEQVISGFRRDTKRSSDHSISSRRTGLSFFSLPVPQVLPFAEVQLLRPEDSRKWKARKSNSLQSKYNLGRKTSEILREIAHYRLHMSLPATRRFKQLTDEEDLEQ
ncbi:unnamed protein product [Calicophoron daubneyi]|uniref:Rho-GAP domain-containing protein n=1 Tax=Calicophoron daubneyi TaxID=300641 RepID=A0AAV2TD18_CALDB